MKPPVCRLCWFLYTLNIYAHFSSHFSQELLMAEIWYFVTIFILVCNIVGSVFGTNQQSRQTGSRNLMGPKTLPTIWDTYMKLVTKYQVSAINSTIDGRNLIFGHKLHIGTPYRGKRFWTHQIPTSCLPIWLVFIHYQQQSNKSVVAVLKLICLSYLFDNRYYIISKASRWNNSNF
jgi:hypothetical protein